jgi:hypothetical protein
MGADDCLLFAALRRTNGKVLALRRAEIDKSRTSSQTGIQNYSALG